ncbi:MAG TPA: ATPase domain-containing protein [Thermoplasmata archaeon]|nr:ATPase domain-containing protein [Thermoplasmata archaeon]
MAKEQTPAKKAPAGATRSVTVPGPEDLERAKDDALLQLRIGRSAHVYAIVVSALLGLDGILLLYFQPHLGSLPPGAWSVSFYVLLPIVAGVALAAVGLASKWEEYALWPWEAHFSTSVGALAVNVLILVAALAHFAGYSKFAGLPLWPWIFPAALAGISLAMVSLVLTWSGWTTRQWASAISALLPLATGLLLLFPPSGASSVDDVLAIGMFLSAIFYQTSGSFLHLISSGTRTHERELITSGQSKMFRIADEIREKEEALHFRELALVKREAAAESDELSIKRQRDALGEGRTQLDQLEEDYRKRSDAVVAKEREWASKSADMDNRERQVEDRNKALDLREQEVGRVQPQISERERRLVDREGELTKRDVELTQRQQELDRRTGGLPDIESRLDARKKELDQKTNELLRREGEVSAREMAAGGALPAATATDLASREAKLQQFKAVLDEQNVALGRKARDNSDRAKQVEAAQKAAAAKEANLAAREATLRQKEAEAADALKDAQDRRSRYDNAAQEYQTRSSALAKSEATAAQRSTDLERLGKGFSDRESTLSAREARLKAAIAEVEQRESRVNARERALATEASEVGLRRQELARGAERAAGAGAGAGAARAVPREGAGTVRDLAAEAVAPAETLRPPTGRRLADRLPTGTPRLDDLLLGGLPPRSHVVLVGDAFVGKEVVVYGFLAEGLKRGEPVILVTAARPPAEVTESLGQVLPQFREYEQMGMVTWVDASGAAPGGPANGHRLAAKGSDDRAGILSALVKASKSAGGDGAQAFRVGFLGLSAVLAHGDERASFSFLQNVVGILKPRSALALYTLEGGALSESQVETLLSRMDGAIIFRQDRDKTFLAVKGLGDVQTRDWVECRASNRGLIVGSFALERIR